MKKKEREEGRVGSERMIRKTKYLCPWCNNKLMYMEGLNCECQIVKVIFCKRCGKGYRFTINASLDKVWRKKFGIKWMAKCMYDMKDYEDEGDK